MQQPAPTTDHQESTSQQDWVRQKPHRQTSSHAGQNNTTDPQKRGRFLLEKSPNSNNPPQWGIVEMAFVRVVVLRRSVVPKRSAVGVFPSIRWFVHTPTIGPNSKAMPARHLCAVGGVVPGDDWVAVIQRIRTTDSLRITKTDIAGGNEGADGAASTASTVTTPNRSWHRQILVADDRVAVARRSRVQTVHRRWLHLGWCQ